MDNSSNYLNGDIITKWNSLLVKIEDYGPLGSKTAIVLMPGVFDIIHNGTVSSIFRVQHYLKHTLGYEQVHVIICIDLEQANSQSKLIVANTIFKKFTAKDIHVFDTTKLHLTNSQKDFSKTVEYFNNNIKESSIKNANLYCLCDCENKQYIESDYKCFNYIDIGANLTFPGIIKVEPETGIVTTQMIKCNLGENRSILNLIPKETYECIIHDSQLLNRLVPKNNKKNRSLKYKLQNRFSV